MGRIEGQLIANPTYNQRELSDIDMFVACSKAAIVMVEGGAKEVGEKELVEALEFAHQAALPIIALQDELRKELGKGIREYDKAPTHDEALVAKVKAACWDGIKQGYTIAVKPDRHAELRVVRNKMLAAMKTELGDTYAAKEKSLKAIFEDLSPRSRWARPRPCAAPAAGRSATARWRIAPCAAW